MKPATLPALSERDFMAQVTQLALIRGWSWLHIRPGMTRDSWRTPISGPLGRGWPDLFLVRVADRRQLAVELKRDGNKATDEQVAVLAILEGAGVECHIWRPTDWPMIERILR
jgi:hypothetical protein